MIHTRELDRSKASETHLQDNDGQTPQAQESTKSKRRISYRGARVGEALHPGPYTYGDATASASNDARSQPMAWVQIGHQRWERNRQINAEYQTEPGSTGDATTPEDTLETQCHECESRGKQVGWTSKGCGCIGCYCVPCSMKDTCNKCNTIGTNSRKGVDFSDWVELGIDNKARKQDGQDGQPILPKLCDITEQAVINSTATSSDKYEHTDRCAACNVSLRHTGIEWRICTCGARICKTCASKGCTECGARLGGEAAINQSPAQSEARVNANRQDERQANVCQKATPFDQWKAREKRMTPAMALARREQRIIDAKAARDSRRKQWRLQTKQQIWQHLRPAKKQRRERVVRFITANITNEGPFKQLIAAGPDMP